MKEIIACSACLLGLNTKYDSLNNFNQKVFAYLRDKTVIVICPEVFGGLLIPRNPSEIRGEKLYDNFGKDVSEYFMRGAEETLSLLKRYGCTKAILKDGSPSCGTTYIYDGTFTSTLKKGLGITAKLLIENGIEIIEIE